MAYITRTPVTAIELGTEKICVLHGYRNDAGNAEVLAFAQAPADGAIRKGVIYDGEKTAKILGEVLDRADRALPANMAAMERKNVYVLLNGMSIQSHRGEGAVTITDSETVQEKHVQEAIDKAQSAELPSGAVSFSAYDSFYVLDHQGRTKEPAGERARHLNAYMHILTTEQKHLDGIRHLLRNLGFEYEPNPVFNGIASAFGVLRQDERERGVLLIDFGQGVCDYTLICLDGVYLSGVLGVGVTHLANDLSIGLNLPYERCMSLLRDCSMTKQRKAGFNFIECPVSASGKHRKIPLDSIERIIELRLREIFSIIHAKVQEKNLTPCIETGIVLCGGGAVLENVVSAAKSVFDLPVRIGTPVDVTGVMAGFQDSPASYAAIQGLLKYALEEDLQQEQDSMNRLREVMVKVGNLVSSRFKLARKALEK